MTAVPQTTVKALVRACRQGREAAWEELLERYGRLIWSVALRLGAHDDEATEVFQRTWVAIVEGIDDLRSADRLASWIAGTTRYQTYRLFAERARARRFDSLDEQLAAGHEPAVEAESEVRIAAIEEQAAVHQALSEMDGRCRELLELLFFSEPPMDYRAIAERTGLAIGSIGPIRARCLSRLRNRFEHLYHESALDDP